MPLNIPNMITLSRIILIPVFVIAFYLPEFSWKHLLVTAVFFFAAVSDWVDGYLARKLEQQSAFGAFLDPVADKLMVATALVLLVGKHPGTDMAVWLAIPAAVIVGREITISALREWMATIGGNDKVRVSLVGKFKTSAQMLAIGFLLFEQPLGAFPTLSVGYILLYISAILTLWSMFMYLKAAWPSLSKEKSGP
ncbi:MAG: CDP-diacylglycerol--glycerol-3-phosphate 3-phosphatidyltransferase [Gammaproteobacteria bacterium]